MWGKKTWGETGHLWGGGDTGSSSPFVTLYVRAAYGGILPLSVPWPFILSLSVKYGG